jgi:hypothetical protein
VPCRFKSVISVIAVCAALACCSQIVEVVESEPGVSDAQSFVDEAVARNSAGRLKPISLTKTGGRRLKVDGGDAYELWYNVVGR